MASQPQPTSEYQRSNTAEYAYEQTVLNKNETASQRPTSDPGIETIAGIDRKDSDGIIFF